jgi:xanthine dehydrogenase accessory factor
MSTTDRRPAQRTAATVLGWLEDGRSFASGVLVGVEGSAPFQQGASVFVDADGAIEGNVTGGCVESAVAQEADDALRSDGLARLLSYGISDELAQTAGLRCGGTVRVLVEPVGDRSRDATRRALEAQVADLPHAMARVIGGPSGGGTLYVDPQERVGTLGDEELDVAVERAARSLVAEGRSESRTFAGGVEVHIAVLADPSTMVILGAIDYSVAVASLARTAGYEITIADPRTAFLASDRFSAVADTVSAWPQDVLAGMTLGPRDAVLVFTHDPKLDIPGVQAALQSGAGYVGALGSRRTTAERHRRLRELGVTEEALDRLHAPCGLDIGAGRPEEVALAILAEIVAVRSGRGGGRLRDTDGPIRERVGEDRAP